MTTFNPKEPNTFHYLTFVTFLRVPIFHSEQICRFFIESLRETKDDLPFKLVAYVIMPDHVHLIINPLQCNIEIIGKTLKGKSARKTLDWLKGNGHVQSMTKLKRMNPKKRNHSYSVWQKGVRSVGLESHKFMRQKADYVHLNPVRAGFCDHPGKWKWSSYGGYLRHLPNDLPMEIDKQPFWTDEELKAVER